MLYTPTETKGEIDNMSPIIGINKYGGAEITIFNIVSILIEPHFFKKGGKCYYGAELK